MDVKKFSLAHGTVMESTSFEILQKSVFHISDSDRLTFVVVTTDNEVWAVHPKSTRLIFSLGEHCEISAMCFLPSCSREENCVALAVFNQKSGDSGLRIVDLATMVDYFHKPSLFSSRATALAPVDPSLRVDTWSLAFGLDNGSAGIFIFSADYGETLLIEDLQSEEQCQCPVSKLSWIKTRRLLVCGYQSGYLSVIRIPSKQVVFGHGIDALPISAIVSTEPENDPRLTCFIWVAAANGRRSSAAVVFRVEGENDNVICMGVHDLAANIPDADTENAWAYLVDISSSRQFFHNSGTVNSSHDSAFVSSNLVSFLWEIGITGRSTDYYFALFDINAWFSWQSQANLQLKEPVFGGSKFLAVFKLPRSVSGDNRLLGAYAISNSISSFRPRVSIVPLTSPLLYPCSLAFDVLCICAEAVTRVRYKSLQETLLKNSCNSDFTRISTVQLSNFVEKLTTLGLIDMFDGSCIGCSHHESVFNAFFKFANEGDAVRFAKKVLLNETFHIPFQNWLYERTVAVRKDLDMSLDLAFKNADAFEHLNAVESDLSLIFRLVSCLPPSTSTFASDLKRVLLIFHDVASVFATLLKSPFFRIHFLQALQDIPQDDDQLQRSFFFRRFNFPFSDVVLSREQFVNSLTSNFLANDKLDNIFLLLYFFFNAVSQRNELSTELLFENLESNLRQVPRRLIRHAGLASFLDRELPSHMIRRCFRLSRPLDYTPEDVLQILRHLLTNDVDFAFEASLQLIAAYETDKESIDWTSEVYFNLFTVFVEIFACKKFFRPPLRLCKMMPSSGDERAALRYLFRSVCIFDNADFRVFLREVFLSSSNLLVDVCSEVDPLRECIAFLCTSKDRALMERACIFLAEGGMPFLAEALAVTYRLGEMRYSSTCDDLVAQRRRLIEDQVSKLPDYVRDRVVSKSKSDSVSWLFTSNLISTLPRRRDSEIIEPDSVYQFQSEDVEKLLVLASKSLLAEVPTAGRFPTSSSFTLKRRSSVLNLPGNQSRLSTAKRCRFVDSPDIPDVPDVQVAAVTENMPMPITPVVTTYPQPQVARPEPDVIVIESDEEETEDEKPLISFRSLKCAKAPSPAQKAARRIVRRSVRFSFSPRRAVEQAKLVDEEEEEEEEEYRQQDQPIDSDAVEIISDEEEDNEWEDGDDEPEALFADEEASDEKDRDLYLSPLGDVPPDDLPKSISVVVEAEPVHSVASSTVRGLIKSVSNISPNRLAAQTALRKSIRLAVNKKKQEIEDAKKAASSSLEENNEPKMAPPQQDCSVVVNQPEPEELILEGSEHCPTCF